MQAQSKANGNASFSDVRPPRWMSLRYVGQSSAETGTDRAKSPNTPTASFNVVVLVIVWYIQDVTQTRQAIRRNYPVIGRFRYLFEHLGEFFRQYFFAMDREELPFNRAERSWVYRGRSSLPIG